MTARNELGQSFGSKKKKLEIRQMTENKVTVDSVHNVADAIMDNIKTNAPEEEAGNCVLVLDSCGS
jgi:hypothetical protein